MERKNTEKKSTENKKDKAFVAVVSGLTSNQAGELARALINAMHRSQEEQLQLEIRKM